MPKTGIEVKAVPAVRGKVTLKQLLAAAESGEYVGFCIACGYEQEGVEPDARKYKCERCGEMKVYGAEELMIMTVT